jgi:hypothetical protein
MIALYICIAIVLVIVSQIVSEIEKSMVGGSGFTRSCSFIITWLSAGMLVGAFATYIFDPRILNGMRSYKRGLP